MSRRPALNALGLSLALAVLVSLGSCQTAENSGSDSRPAGLPDDINDTFTSASLDTEAFIDRWEVESREIYHQRFLIAEWIALREGMTIADIGAGTGLFEGLFSDCVGPRGRVHAVDISEVFLRDLDRRIQDEGWTNVETNLTNGVVAPTELKNLDRVFICDTYHHFEHPRETMESLFQAMKPGGVLVLVDFERIPGVTRNWIMEHVRAGKAVFRAEVEAAGFKFEEEAYLPGFRENYLIRFVRP